MSEDPSDPLQTGPRQRAVPSGRAARFGQFGRLAASVSGGMIAEGVRRLAAGERPQMRNLLLTPGNVRALADRLSHLRGAAMKLGQMISMDAGDFLPPELAHLMAGLRDNAHHMPPQQLQQVLAAEWGKDWRTRFEWFEPRPIAAASIGQVHRAMTRDGRLLAIKVQYPGVRASINADVDNVATLLRVSGLLPKELDVTALLAEAKRQLAEEADYDREGAQMLNKDFTTANVLAMSFIKGQPIESLVTAPQATRDAVMTTLIGLVLRELFEFGVMQTGTNFANDRFQPETGRLVLLDFGATRAVPPETALAYRRVLQAGLDADRMAVRSAAVTAGFIGRGAISGHGDSVDRMINLIVAEMHRPGLFDFSDRRFVGTLRDEGAMIVGDKAAWHIPPTDLLFVQRKIGGTALLAARLEARVDVRALARDALSPTGGG